MLTQIVTEHKSDLNITVILKQLVIKLTPIKHKLIWHKHIINKDNKVVIQQNANYELI